MGSAIVYEDQWGEVIDRPDADLIEIRWFDTTRNLDGERFNSWLLEFASCVERAGRSRVLTDSTVFRMPMDRLDGAWRDANIIPRYNAAGVEKFAFLMPHGMPAIGAPPAREGPATFPTGYFGSRADALGWLGS
jgi:hypothetical protein